MNESIEYLKAAQAALAEAFVMLDPTELETLEARQILSDCRRTIWAMDPDTFEASDPDDCEWPFSEVA